MNINLFYYMIVHNIKLEEEIFKYIAPEGKLIPQRCVIRLLKKKNWYDYLKNLYPNLTYPEGDVKFIREVLYRLINNIDELPKCRTCGKTLHFSNDKFPIFCSKKCSNADPEVLERNRESVRKAQRKNQETIGDKILEKRKSTIKERYGVETSSPYGIPEVQKKIKKSIKEKFGVDNVFKLQETKNKRLDNLKRETTERWEQFLRKTVIWPDFDSKIPKNKRILIIKDYCPIHGDVEVPLGDACLRVGNKRYYEGCLCFKCNPKVPKEERKILAYSKASQKLYKKLIALLKESNINNKIYYATLNKEFYVKTKTGRYLDYYDETENIIIEFNGDLWHGNPSMFGPDDLVKRPFNSNIKVPAKELWDNDNKRYKEIRNELPDCHYLIIWEYDAFKYTEEVLKELVIFYKTKDYSKLNLVKFRND